MNLPSHIDKVHYTGSKTISVALSRTKVFAPILIYQQISKQDLLSYQKSQPKSRASHDITLITSMISLKNPFTPIRVQDNYGLIKK